MKYVAKSDKKSAVEVDRGQKMQSLEYPGAWKENLFKCFKQGNDRIRFFF